MSKKGLAVIYDPHNVYQFLWYYCTYGKDIEWSALCLPNSYKGEYLSEPCKKLGVFKTIFRDTQQFDSMSLKKRLLIFLKMFFYALVGKQKKFSRNFINKFIGNYDFDTAVVLTDVGLVSGLFLTLAPEKEIIILEDGMGDYEAREWKNIFKSFSRFYDVQGFILSLLGYSNIGHYFPLKTTKNCIKFCSHPDKMLYRKYKDIKLLFDFTDTYINLFKQLLSKIYIGIEEYFSDKKDLILFTTPLNDLTPNKEKYNKKVEHYINNYYKGRSILIKKHPRDISIYSFDKSITVTEIDNAIPAEVLLPFLKDMEIIFYGHSSTNLYLVSFGYNPSFFYFNGLDEESKAGNSLCKYRSKKDFKERLKFFELEKSKVIEL